MFLQMFRTRVRDAAAMHHALHRWVRDLSPGADGWVGTTAGLTDDLTFVGIVRFESSEAARRNSDRREQGEWWSETSALCTEDVRFLDCPEIEFMKGGGSDDAEFVQVVEGRSRDIARSRELYAKSNEWVLATRPEVLGEVVGIGDDGEFVRVVYFTSEHDARHGERRRPPEDVRGVLDEMQSLVDGRRYYDLRDPWLWSPTSHRG